MDDLQKAILDEVVARFRPLFQKAADNSLKLVQEEVRYYLLNSNEYYSLLPDGILYGQIGNPDIEQDARSVVEEIVTNIKVNSKIVPVQKRGNEFYASFEINILPVDFHDILGLPEASFHTEKGYTLDWLRWILLEGKNDIVLGYHFWPKIGAPSSRTGIGIMEKSGNWGIKSHDAGTINDNWLTRQMKYGVGQILPQQVEAIFRKELA